MLIDNSNEKISSFFNLLKDTQSKNLEHNLKELIDAHPSLLKATESGSGDTPLMVAVANGNIAAVRYLIKRKINPYQKDSTGKNIIQQYDPMELVQYFSGSSSDDRERFGNQMKCLCYILESIYKEKYEILFIIINKKFGLRSAAQKVLDTVEQVKKSLQVLNEIKILIDAEKQARMLDQYAKLCIVIIEIENLLSGVEYVNKIASGQRHIGKIVAGTMLSVLGILGIIAGVVLILTGIGIPFAIFLKIASTVALYSGTAAISVGLIGVMGGGTLAYCNREKGVKRAARKFFEEVQPQVRKLL